MKIKTRNLVIGYFTIFSFIGLLITFFTINQVLDSQPTKSSHSNIETIGNALGSALKGVLIIGEAFLIYLLIITITSLIGYYISKSKNLKEHQKGFAITTILSLILLMSYVGIWIMS